MSMGFRNSTIFIISLLLSGSGLASKVVYKWADDDGVIHYTATPPLERGSKAINKQGLVVGERAAPMSREERRRLQQQSMEEAKKDASRSEANRRGRLLLATYRSEADITARLQQILDNLGGEIDLANRALATETERLRNQVRRAANLQRRKQTVSAEMQAEINNQRQTVVTAKRRIFDLQDEIANERTRFAKDLARYRDISARINPG